MYNIFRTNLSGRLVSWLVLAALALLAFGVVNASADVIIDNGDTGTSYTGTWRVSGGLSPYGVDSLWARDGATYTWGFDSQPAGTYKVGMWWSEWASRATDIGVEVNHGVGTDTISINQYENAGQWNSLGTYYLDTSGSVTITAAYGSTAVSYTHLTLPTN